MVVVFSSCRRLDHLYSYCPDPATTQKCLSTSWPIRLSESLPYDDLLPLRGVRHDPPVLLCDLLLDARHFDRVLRLGHGSAHLDGGRLCRAPRRHPHGAPSLSPAACDYPPLLAASRNE